MAAMGPAARRVIVASRVGMRTRPKVAIGNLRRGVASQEDEKGTTQVVPFE